MKRRVRLRRKKAKNPRNQNTTQSTMMSKANTYGVMRTKTGNSMTKKIKMPMSKDFQQCQRH